MKMNLYINTRKTNSISCSTKDTQFNSPGSVIHHPIFQPHASIHPTPPSNIPKNPLFTKFCTALKKNKNAQDMSLHLQNISNHKTIQIQTGEGSPFHFGKPLMKTINLYQQKRESFPDICQPQIKKFLLRKEQLLQKIEIEKAKEESSPQNRIKDESFTTKVHAVEKRKNLSVIELNDNFLTEDRTTKNGALFLNRQSTIHNKSEAISLEDSPPTSPVPTKFFGKPKPNCKLDLLNKQASLKLVKDVLEQKKIPLLEPRPVDEYKLQQKKKHSDEWKINEIITKKIQQQLMKKNQIKTSPQLNKHKLSLAINKYFNIHPAQASKIKKVNHSLPPPDLKIPGTKINAISKTESNSPARNPFRNSILQLSPLNISDDEIPKDESTQFAFETPKKNSNKIEEANPKITISLLDIIIPMNKYNAKYQKKNGFSDYLNGDYPSFKTKYSNFSNGSKFNPRDSQLFSKSSHKNKYRKESMRKTLQSFTTDSEYSEFGSLPTPLEIQSRKQLRMDGKKTKQHHYLPISKKIIDPLDVSPWSSETEDSSSKFHDGL